MAWEIVAALSVIAWAYLVLGRGGFWLATPVAEKERAPADPVVWPRIAAIIPARDEAQTVGETVASLLAQDHPGDFDIFVVDDASSDNTAAVAREAAARCNAAGRLTVLETPPLPSGWSGKLWALQQGVFAARQADYLLLTDADIRYAPDALRTLVARALSGRHSLVSIMATLRCRSFAERIFVPAFVFFFQMLYPFSWVNRRENATAAAAGGCMLVKRDALEEAGGIASIRGALIDDCALAARMKKVGPIHLSLSHKVISLRPYAAIGDFRKMVVRSAYTELNHSPLLLAAMAAGLGIAFIAAPLAALFASGPAQWAGAIVWLVMALAYQPILRFYALLPLWGVALPLIALTYLIWTFDSAFQHARGRGGLWKGRVQAGAR